MIMQLLIKQRVFAWGDKYDVYDEQGNVKYYVEAEIFTLGHKIHVYDIQHKELAVIRERLLTMLPVFEVEVNGRIIGTIQKKFSLFRPKYEIDYNGWRVEGDFLSWEYDVYSACSPIIHITKKLLSWGDTYSINILDEKDELDGLLLVIAIDAAKCEDD